MQTFGLRIEHEAQVGLQQKPFATIEYPDEH
jgi:hypothetical protein